MNIKDFVKDNPGFINDTLPTYNVAGKVFAQVIRHNRRCDVLDLLEIQRPNEDASIKAYQNANRRMVTKKNIDSFINLTTRILHETDVNVENQSDTLKEYLETNPFVNLGQKVSLDTYLDTCLFPALLEDPNGLFVILPINPRNPDIAPAASIEDGGLPENEAVSFKFLTVSHKDIRPTPKNTFCFLAGHMQIEGNGRKSNEPYYYIVDDSFYYRHTPLRYDSSGNVVYELQPWYFHDCGEENKRETPLIVLPGKLATCEENGVDYKYNESFLHGALEYYDEGLMSFIDNIGVRVQHNYPKVIMSHLPCPEDGCNKGKVKSINKTDGTKTISECTGCNGTGRINNPGVYGVLLRPEGGLDEKSVDSPYEYITPPLESINNSLEVAENFFAKGDNAIGLDLMESLNESGVAKEVRLEPLQDVLRPIGKGLLELKQRINWILECLLVKERSRRVKPVVRIPNDYKIKTIEMLRDDAKNALPADRTEREITLYQKEYRGDEKKIKARKLALAYSPLLTMDLQEIETFVNLGAYDINDVIKSRKAVEAFDSISKQDTFLLMTQDQAFTLADAYIQPFLKPILVQGTFDDANNEDE